MNRIGTRTARFCTLVMLLLLVLVPAVASAKDFSIEGINIVSTVDPNGDLNVIEERTVGFDGQFSWVEWSLNTQGSDGIEVLGVYVVKGGVADEYRRVEGVATEAGTYSVADTGDAVTARVAISALDETVPFRISYVAKNAVKRYSDTAELYWQFVGDETDIPSGAVHVEIAPPELLAKSDVKAWAHGPLTGNVAIAEDGKVSLDVPELPANTFVEARVLYPADVLASAAVIDEPRLQTVTDEEAQWAAEADAVRTQARATTWGAIGLSGLLSLGGLAFAVWAFLRHGREYKAAFPGGYLREDPRPDIAPGVIGALWRFGVPDNADIAATLMDLADKAVISLRSTSVHHDGVLGIGAKDVPSFELGRNPNPGAGTVGPTDRTLLHLLFDEIGAGGVVTLEEIKSFAKDTPKRYTEQIKAWSDECEATAQALGMFEGNSWSWRIGMFFLAAVVGAVGFFSAVFVGSFWPLVLAAPSAIAIGVIAAYMLRRSREGNELFAQYRAVHDYLRDFGRLDEVPPASIILWNRFLVLAVVFGIATEVINQLRVKVPAVVGDPGFQTTYWWVYAGSGSSSPVSELQGGFASASQIASSAMSSSGSGGGFSGGGGGGGGGGGFSAG